MACGYILEKGHRAGQTCGTQPSAAGARYCKRHEVVVNRQASRAARPGTSGSASRQFQVRNFRQDEAQESNEPESPPWDPAEDERDINLTNEAIESDGEDSSGSDEEQNDFDYRQNRNNWLAEELEKQKQAQTGETPSGDNGSGEGRMAAEEEDCLPKAYETIRPGELTDLMPVIHTHIEELTKAKEAEDKAKDDKERGQGGGGGGGSGRRGPVRFKLRSVDNLEKTATTPSSDVVQTTTEIGPDGKPVTVVTRTRNLTGMVNWTKLITWKGLLTACGLVEKLGTRFGVDMTGYQDDVRGDTDIRDAFDQSCDEWLPEFLANITPTQALFFGLTSLAIVRATANAITDDKLLEEIQKRPEVQQRLAILTMEKARMEQAQQGMSDKARVEIALDLTRLETDLAEVRGYMGGILAPELRAGLERAEKEIMNHIAAIKASSKGPAHVKQLSQQIVHQAAESESDSDSDYSDDEEVGPWRPPPPTTPMGQVYNHDVPLARHLQQQRR